MSVLLFTYDLNNERHKKGDYEGLYKIRDAYDYIRLSESSYALNTTHTPEQVFKRVEQYLDGDDHLYVITLKRPYFGRGKPARNKWLADHLEY